MLVTRVDGFDRPIGSVDRSKVFVLRVNFRVVHIWVFDPGHRLLLQQIAASHERHPGYWGSSVAGYVAAGESYKDAAERKLREELGLRMKPTFVGKTRMLDQGCIKFIGLFRATARPAILRPNPKDFENCQFVNPARGSKLPEPLTPTFQFLFSRPFVQRRLLS